MISGYETGFTSAPVKTAEVSEGSRPALLQTPAVGCRAPRPQDHRTPNELVRRQEISDIVVWLGRKR